MTPECPVCHQKAAYAGNTVYCPHCGWNRDSAISSLRMSLNATPIAMVMFGGMVAWTYWGMKFRNAPMLMIFMAIPALGIAYNHFSVRRNLAKLQALSARSAAPPASSSVSGPGASMGAMSGFASPFGSTAAGPSSPAVVIPPSPKDEALLRAPLPRTIRMSGRGRFGLALATIFVGALLAAITVHLYKVATIGDSFRRDDWLAAGIACLLLLVPVGMWRAQVAECQLLENGEIVLGRVLRQWRDKDGHQIDYEFTDFTGQSHRGMAQDYTGRLLPDMPVPVFYERDNPKRQIASCATLHEVVLDS